MPTRLIREGWLESELINELSTNAEVFFLRLCLRADDFGRFYASEQLLKSSLYPLKNDVTNDCVSECLLECEKVGLLTRYNVDGKSYVSITKFNQRTRALKSKFPSPSKNDGHMPVICPSHDGHLPDNVRHMTGMSDLKAVNIGESPEKIGEAINMPVICPSHDGHLPDNVRLFGGGDGGGDGDGKKSIREKKNPNAVALKNLPENWEPNDSHKALAKEQGVNLEECVGFFRDWAEAGGKRYASWDACFRTALKSWLPEKVGRNGSGRPNPKMHPLEVQKRLEAIKHRMHEILVNMPRYMPDGSKSYGKFRDQNGTLKSEFQVELERLKVDAETYKATLLNP